MIEKLEKKINELSEKEQQILSEYLEKQYAVTFQENKEDIIECSNCNGRGEFEISAGSHSFFKDCDICNGRGITKK